MSWRHREAQIVYKYIILCHKDIVYVIAARPQERNGVSSHWQDDWLFFQYDQLKDGRNKIDVYFKTQVVVFCYFEFMTEFIDILWVRIL